MSGEALAYEITVRGHLDHHWGAWSRSVDLVHRDDGTTTMDTGPVDQARLHGILARLRDTGAVLVAVTEWEHPPSWHDRGMARTRLSTTVDADLLVRARKASGKPDSAMVDDALAASLARHRAAEVDASYAAYDAHPLDEPDEWGDLASFRRAAAAS